MLYQDIVPFLVEDMLIKNGGIYSKKEDAENNTLAIALLAMVSLGMSRYCKPNAIRVRFNKGN